MTSLARGYGAWKSCAEFEGVVEVLAVQVGGGDGGGGGLPWICV